MFEFMGNGAAQAIMDDRGVLQVYGYKDVKARTVVRDCAYNRNSIAYQTNPCTLFRFLPAN